MELGEGEVMILVISGLCLKGRLVVALEHGLAVFAEGVEVLSQDGATPYGFPLVDLHL